MRPVVVGISVVLLLLIPAIAITVSVFLSYRAISNSNHNWCSVVSIITAKPVPETPATIKSGQFAFYTDLVILKRQLGCE